MSSRKRAKGKQRKLTQQARKPVERSVSQPPPTPNGENINSLPEQSIRRIEHAENVECYHGEVYIDEGHPVNAFNNSFIKTFTCVSCEDRDVSTVTDSMDMSFEKHREVWKDDEMRKMAIKSIVSYVTDKLEEGCIHCAKLITVSIMLLEYYNGEETLNSAKSKATEDVTYLLNAEERDVVHFYKKRIPCSCLDEFYSEIKKSQVRGGTCYHCKQTVKSKDIKTCSRCKCAQYCSKECQRLAWPSHKEHCLVVSRFHKNAKKSETARSNKE